MARSIPDWPRMMRRARAAAYLDLTSAEFEREVAAGRLPTPVKLGSCEHWDRHALDEHIERLTGGAPGDWRKDQPLYAA